MLIQLSYCLTPVAPNFLLTQMLAEISMIMARLQFYGNITLKDTHQDCNWDEKLLSYCLTQIMVREAFVTFQNTLYNVLEFSLLEGSIGCFDTFLRAQQLCFMALQDNNSFQLASGTIIHSVDITFWLSIIDLKIKQQCYIMCTLQYY